MNRTGHPQAAGRPGIVLLVVLALLTLFAIVGISFVLYANSEANASRFFREGEAPPVADMDPEQLIAYFLSQLIYDVDDERPNAVYPNVYSALRGHSLARSMYGYYYTLGAGDPIIPNDVPFNGAGRLRTAQPFPVTSTLRVGPLMEPINEYHCVNYTPWDPNRGYPGPAYPNVRHDPERPGFRAFNGQPNPFVGGFNVPYTYPDLNNMFLAAVRANDGAVLMPSFHRPWLFGPLVGANPNWTNAEGKWLSLRPRPQEMGPNFPLPEDAGGDVKNLINSPGTYLGDDSSGGPIFANNDSVWLDLGAPVMIAPDGTKFKPLFAPLVMDLDNRINLNVHGNVRGQGVTHASNQGWGPWEVDISKVLGFNWANMFRGNQTYNESGRYHYGTKPTSTFPPGNFASPGVPNHYYGPVDFDGCKSPAALFMPTDRLITWLRPQSGGLFCPSFPLRPLGYDDGDNNERQDHPLLYNFFNPQKSNNPNVYDLTFPISNMEALLRYGETNSPGLTSNLYRLAGQNFDPAQTPAAAKNRWLVTTHSFDMGRAGVSPWTWDPNQDTSTSLRMQPVVNRTLIRTDYPTGQPVAFQGVNPPARPVPPGAATPGSEQGDFRVDWRAVNAALTKIDLNRELTPYPIRKQNQALPFHPYTNTVVPMNPTDPQFVAAERDRQNFAHDIYLRLVVATGAYHPYYNTAVPSLTQLVALRWLAQLAANIVDFIDSDDIMTRFEWTAVGNGRVLQGINAHLDEFPINTKPWTRYVFGTELPRVVINEVYAESIQKAPLMDRRYEIDFWVELYNPMFRTGDPALGDVAGSVLPNMVGDTEAADPTRGYALLQSSGAPRSAYQLVITRPRQPSEPTDNSNIYFLQETKNVTGDPIPTRVMRGPNGDCVVTDRFLPPTANANMNWIEPSGGAFDVDSSATGPKNKGFYVIGPGKPFPTDGTPGSRYPIPSVQDARLVAEMTYPDVANPNALNVRPTVLLRRLACPYLPPNDTTNPYVTVDYVEKVQVNLASVVNAMGQDVTVTPVPQRQAWGRNQPYHGRNPDTGSDLWQETPNDPGNTELAHMPKHTFFRQNARANTPAALVSGDPLNVPFDWLPHLDRQLISPLEILNVSGFRPHELTQHLHGDATTSFGEFANFKYAHLAPWFDQQTRLYRAFEFFETHDRAAGVARGARIPGKVNLNTVWDEETFQALCAALPRAAMQSPNNFRQEDVSAMFQNLLKLRHRRTAPATTYPPGQNDRPFLGMAAGLTPVDAQHPPSLYNGIGTGINDTFLRALPTGMTDNPDGTPDGGRTRMRLFGVNPPTDNPLDHPQIRFELMNKLFNNVTTRSNVFAVWVTVGFFKVENDATRPVKLGAEIGKAENRNIRHRMFAIVDRSNLAIDATGVPPQPPILLSGSTVRDPATYAPLGIAISGATFSGGMLKGTYEGYDWTIKPGRTLMIGHGTEFIPAAGRQSLVDNNVNVAAIVPPAGNLPAYIRLPASSALKNWNNGPFMVMPFRDDPNNPANQLAPPSLGNPGPKPGFNPRQYPWVVRHFSIIQ